MSDPIRYPARGGSAEAMRQDIWRTRRDLEDALGELLFRFDVKAMARRRMGSMSRSAAHNPVAIASVGLAVAAGVAIAAAPAVRHRWRIVAIGGLGVLAGAAVVSRRRPAITPTAIPVKAGSSPLDGFPSPPGGDVINVLLEQHRQVRAAFNGVLASSGRDKFYRFAALVELLNRHEHTEQEIVHPLVERLDSAQPIAAERIAEENAADRLLSRLISMGVQDRSFNRQLAELAKEVAKHAAAEESEEFPLLRGHVPVEQLQTMANQVRAAQAEPW